MISGLILMLAAIAPLTKSDLDNKVLDALRWFEDTVIKLVFPSLAPKADPEPPKTN
jgi:hypothetical protein